MRTCSQKTKASGGKRRGLVEREFCRRALPDAMAARMFLLLLVAASAALSATARKAGPGAVLSKASAIELKFSVCDEIGQRCEGTDTRGSFRGCSEALHVLFPNRIVHKLFLRNQYSSCMNVFLFD